MFDETLKAMGNGQPTKLSIPIAPDEKGYFDRQCPSERCRYRFKLYASDLKEKIGEKKTYCPMCRVDDDANNWKPSIAKEQLAAAKAHAVEHMRDLLHNALTKDAKKFNRSRHGGFISMSMELKPRKKPILPPVPSTEAYRLEITCEHCRVRFAVLGSAFFCPGCGRSTVEHTFDQSLAKTKAKAEGASRVRQQYINDGQPDLAADLERDLIESGIADCVSAFQHLCDSLWERKNPSGKDPKNSFQNLDKGSALWMGFCGEGYENWMPEDQRRRLKVFFQRRHVLEHCGGVVDSDYLVNSKDTTYAPGQRVGVTVEDVVEVIALVDALAGRLRAKLSSIP